MYASIRRYKAKSTADLKRRVNDEFVPVISKLPGFIGFYAIDTGGAEIASVSIFETKPNAEESNKIAADWVKKNIPSIGTAEKIVGEIIAHKVAKTQLV